MSLSSKQHASYASVRCTQKIALVPSMNFAAPRADKEPTCAVGPSVQAIEPAAPLNALLFKAGNRPVPPALFLGLGTDGPKPRSSSIALRAGLCALPTMPPRRTDSVRHVGDAAPTLKLKLISLVKSAGGTGVKPTHDVFAGSCVDARGVFECLGVFCFLPASEPTRWPSTLPCPALNEAGREEKRGVPRGAPAGCPHGCAGGRGVAVAGLASQGNGAADELVPSREFRLDLGVGGAVGGLECVTESGAASVAACAIAASTTLAVKRILWRKRPCAGEVGTPGLKAGENWNDGPVSSGTFGAAVTARIVSALDFATSCSALCSLQWRWIVMHASSLAMMRNAARAAAATLQSL